MYVSTTFKEFVRHKLNEEIKATEQLIKEEPAGTKTARPDWISEMIKEFNEITKDL